MLRFLPSLFVREGDTVAAALLSTVAPVRGELLQDCHLVLVWPLQPCLKFPVSLLRAGLCRAFKAASSAGTVLWCRAGGEVGFRGCLGNNVLLLLLSSSSHDGHPHGHDR